MRTIHFTSTSVAGLALLFAQTAVQAQSGYGYPVFSPATPAYGYPTSRPVIIGNSYPSTSPCANGRCPLPSSRLGVSSRSTPCATGNCPTSTGCRTICGPTGCQTICPPGSGVGATVGPCGPNGCPPRPYGASTGVNPTIRTLPTLNLDLAPQWNTPGYTQPYQGPTNYPQPSVGPTFAPRNRGVFNPYDAQGSFEGDRSVQLY